MRKITTFLTFNDQAEAAVHLYVTVFKNSKIVSASGPKGAAVSLTFQLDGQDFIALNGGPSFTFSEGISLFVHCGSQAEIDDYSAKLTAGGGAQGPCGWLKDKFGVSWQIIPESLGKMLGDKDPKKAGRVRQAMLQMKRLDIAKLQQAYDG